MRYVVRKMAYRAQTSAAIVEQTGYSPGSGLKLVYDFPVLVISCWQHESLWWRDVPILSKVWPSIGYKSLFGVAYEDSYRLVVLALVCILQRD